MESVRLPQTTPTIPNQELTLPSDFRQHRILRLSFWIKLTFILVEGSLAVAFAVCTFRSKYNIAAVLEWAVAFIFTFYVLSFFVDLVPAVKTKGRGRGMGMETEMEREESGSGNGRGNGRGNGEVVGKGADGGVPIGSNF